MNRTFKHYARAIRAFKYHLRSFAFFYFTMGYGWGEAWRMAGLTI